LASAYENNADFNAARAQLRGIDENVELWVNLGDDGLREAAYRGG
jgi:hypothetical protein